MELFDTLKNLLAELALVLQRLPAGAYTERLPVLSHATIGEHTRHMLEFFVELDKGYETGMVCYDERQRDKRIETDIRFATRLSRSLTLRSVRSDRALTLKHGNHGLLVATNYYRELVYNIEHMIHHMALLRIGIASVAQLELPGAFGVAASTIAYRESCAQ